MHKYVIMGKQGCGKGTQAKLLCADFDLIHISVGDIFRWHVQNHTKLGAKVKRIIAKGNLVGDDVVEQIIHERLQMHNWNYGFILDGFPRNDVQADFFLENYDVDAVIHVHVDDGVVIERVMARRVCSNCGLDYNLIFHRPADPDICDVCGGRLVARTDDNTEALKTRLGDFTSRTLPAIELFERKELVITVDGSLPSDVVQAAIRDRLGLPQRASGAEPPRTAARPAVPG